MKASNLFYLFLASPILFSCNGSSETAAKDPDSVFTTSCYRAADGQDTALLTLKNFKKKTEGSLLIKFSKKDKNEGNIIGVFRGDTLFVDYGFQVGKSKSWYKNPLALLKKDGKLIMGVGKMETTLGRTYFRKDIPIDFESGRFTFEPITCDSTKKP